MFLLTSLAVKSFNRGVQPRHKSKLTSRHKFYTLVPMFIKKLVSRLGGDIITVFQTHRQSWHYVLNKLQAAD